MSEHVQTMTEAEYLAWEVRQELRHEFDGLRVVAMNGGTINHERIQSNLKFASMARLRGSRCEPFGPNMRMPSGQGRYRYPDVLVTCSPLDGRAPEVTDPVVIFETISDSTVEIDRKIKLVEYCAMPSAARYIIVEQNEALATVISRNGDHWRLDFRRADQVIELPELGTALPVNELYEGIDISAGFG